MKNRRRVHDVEMKPIYQKIFERAKPFLRTRKNLIHTRIVLRYGFILLEMEKGDEGVVIPAILLHDVGWKALPERLHGSAFGPNPSRPELTKVHEVEGAKIAHEILKEARYAPEKAKEICRIIRGHDTRKRPLSRNDRIVKDADKLFRYSREGLAIDSDRFRLARTDRLDFLEAEIERWFFLSASRRLAATELAERRREDARRPVRSHLE